MIKNKLFHTYLLLFASSTLLSVPNENENIFDSSRKKFNEKFINLSSDEFLEKIRSNRSALPALVKEYFKNPDSIEHGIVKARKYNTGKTQLEAIAFANNLKDDCDKKINEIKNNLKSSYKNERTSCEIGILSLLTTAFGCIMLEDYSGTKTCMQSTIVLGILSRLFSFSFQARAKKLEEQYDQVIGVKHTIENIFNIDELEQEN